MTFHPKTAEEGFRCKICGKRIPVQETILIQFHLKDSLCLDCLHWSATTIRRLAKNKSKIN